VSHSVVGRIRAFGAIAAVFAMALMTVGVAGAGANTVVNGDFEAGTLEGWVQANQPEPPTGEWIVYGPGEDPFPPPPQGEFAAGTVQSDPGTHILYQDVPIEAGQPYLSMTVYYDSDAAITVPSPATLAASGVDNQQYRIDVVDPAAPLESLDSSDIFATVFRTLEGDAASIAPRKVGVDLSAFAGQTVRLRLAEVDNHGLFNAGVDSVTTGQVPPLAPPLLPAPVPPSNVFTAGKLKLNKKNGTATLKVTLPGAGILTATDAKKKAPKRIKKAMVTATVASTVTLNLKPTGAGKKTLKNTGKLQFKALLSFTPTGGTAGTSTFKGKLKLTPPS
jgi:hypothetical protein